MPFESLSGGGSSMMSPGGFEFGVQGWIWGEPNPKSITFFLDGSVMVCDQHGRPIKGVVSESGEALYFATTPPPATTDNSMPYEKRFHVDNMDRNGKHVQKYPLATHVQVVAALVLERIDWMKLNRAGTPQLPYDELKKVPNLPLLSDEEVRRIPDRSLRSDLMKLRREQAEIRSKELEAAEAE